MSAPTESDRNFFEELTKKSECSQYGAGGYGEHYKYYIAGLNRGLTAPPKDDAPVAACKTCMGQGMIGGHTGQTPESLDFWEEPCPDCSPLNIMETLKEELTSWLKTQNVTSDNIGEIRRSLFVPWDSKWNGIVRDETAAVEREAAGI